MNLYFFKEICTQANILNLQYSNFKLRLKFFISLKKTSIEDNHPLMRQPRQLGLYISAIVDVRVAYIRKLAILGDRNHIVTANYSPVLCSYLWGPLDFNP